MRDHERICFEQQAGLEAGELDTHNLLDDVPPLERVRSYDALMIGGSGAFYISKSSAPWFDAFFGLLRDVVDVGHPTLGCCFGYHALVHTLGGRIVHTPHKTEVGTFQLKREPAAEGDPLLGHLPETFAAQLGHKDQPAAHPPGVENLASSERSPLQAFRVPRKPIWAVQFHPELDEHKNRERFMHYLESYSEALDEKERQEVQEKFAPSPETSEILPRFLRLVAKLR